MLTAGQYDFVKLLDFAVHRAVELRKVRSIDNCGANESNNNDNIIIV